METRFHHSVSSNFGQFARIRFVFRLGTVPLEDVEFGQSGLDPCWACLYECADGWEFIYFCLVSWRYFTSRIITVYRTNCHISLGDKLHDD